MLDLGSGGENLDMGGSLAGFGVVLGSSADGAGSATGAAGDVNGDGLADIVVGAPNAPSSGGVIGAAYVAYGQDFTAAVAHAPGSTATANGQSVIGTSGDDTLSSSTSSGIVISAGAGDDTVFVNGLEQRVNGGGDTAALGGTGDTLRIATDDLPLNFLSSVGGSQFHLQNKYEGFERIDMTGAGSNTLTLDPRDLLDLSTTTHTLFVTGDAAGVDSVSSSGWSPGGTVVDGGITYNRYTFGTSAAELLIDGNLTQAVI